MMKTDMTGMIEQLFRQCVIALLFVKLTDIAKMYFLAYMGFVEQWKWIKPHSVFYCGISVNCFVPDDNKLIMFTLDLDWNSSSCRDSHIKSCCCRGSVEAAQCWSANPANLFYRTGLATLILTAVWVSELTFGLFMTPTTFSSRNTCQERVKIKCSGDF